MPRHLVAVLSALLALSPAALQTQAATVHVWRVGTWNGVPGDFTSIQAAVDRAGPGDWILVAPGDYHEKGRSGSPFPAGVVIDKPGIHLRGMDRNSVIVDGTNPNPLGACSGNPAVQDLGPLDASGAPQGRSGVVAYLASGVYIENLTTCNFLTGSNKFSGNQIWWDGGDGTGKIGIHGWWGNYITATSTYSNGVGDPKGEYGIYIDNTDGPGYVDHSYASNMGDAGYYIGACPNCNSAIYHGHAQFNALGYSGTNSGGNLVIENTEFDHNKTGLTSNAQNNDDQPSPQFGQCPAGSSPPVEGAVGCTVFMHNSIHDNNDASVPGAGSGLAGGAPVGTGVVLAGTQYVTLYDNQVYNNGAWGILVADLPDQENAPPGFPECTGGTWAPGAGVCYYNAFGNYTWANTLWNNGFFGNPSNGDLGLATVAHNPGNCFHRNTDPQLPGGQPTTDPPGLQQAPYYPCGQANSGDMAVLGSEALCATQLVFPCPTVPGATYPRPGQVTLGMPPPQPSMPNPCAGVPANPWCRA